MFTNTKFSGVVLLIGLSIALLVGACTQSKQELDKVRFRLNWQPGAEHVAYFVALEKGFYRDADLDVDISVGSGSADSVKLVAAGEADFALAAGANVIQARSAGMPLLVVGVIYQDDPTAFTVLSDSGIRKLDDLIGRKIGVALESSTYPEYLALLQQNRIPRSSVTEIPVRFGIEPLLVGQVDAFPGFLTQIPFLVETAGKEPYVIAFKDYGVNIYGVSIITAEKTAQQRTDLTRRFVSASFRGWEYVFEHREEAIDILMQRFPVLDRTKLTKELDLLIPLIQTDLTKQKGLGYSVEARWTDAAEMLFEQGVIKQNIDITTLFTNEFVTGPK